MAVPKRKMSRSATRSRKSANMRLAPGALAVPELRRVAASAHGVRQLRLVPRPPGPRRRVPPHAERTAPPLAGRTVPPVIAIDAMGGDRAPAEIVAGALRAVDELRRRRPARRPPRRRSPRTCPAGRRPRGVEVLDASEVIAMDEEPAAAVRTKKDSSIVRGAEAVRDGRAAAMVGAGNTGATMAAALLRLRPDQGRAPARDRGAAPGVRRGPPAAARRRRRDRRPGARVARRVGRARARVRPCAPRRRRADDRAALERRGAGQGRRAAQGRVAAVRRREGLRRQRRGPRPRCAVAPTSSSPTGSPATSR